MSSVGSRVPTRTAIACERCRRLRKRCQPPRPCPACRDAGEPCEVRTKARPMRGVDVAQLGEVSAQKRSTTDAATPHRSTPSDIRNAAHYRMRSSTLSHEGPSAAPSGEAHQVTRQAPDLLSYKERIHNITRLVFEYADEHFGEQLRCDLTEPWLALWEVKQDAEIATSGVNQLYTSYLDRDNVSRWVSAFNNCMSILRSMVPDEAQLLHLADTIRESQALQQVDAKLSRTNPHGWPADQAVLLFAVLALGSLHVAEYANSRSLFEESCRLLDGYPKEPTFHLCVAIYIQHVYILTTGTSNRAKAIASLNIQVAHDLGMHRVNEDPGQIERLRLYLLILMADQYSAQTHGSKPTNDLSQLQDGLLDPLIQQEPDVSPLLQIMRANNVALAALAEKDQNWVTLHELEAEIGRQCMLAQQSITPNYSRQTLCDMYGPVARIHMFWFRLLLRSPFLARDTTWMSSLSICLHAAQAILSVYFEMAAPALRIDDLEDVADQSDTLPWRWSKAVLPPTWRQVQRIMIATFIIMLSYWKGEITKLEATRYMSMSLLLLSYQSARWGCSLDECKATVQTLATLSEFDLRRGTKTLLVDYGTVSAAALETSIRGGTGVTDQPLDSDLGPSLSEYPSFGLQFLDELPLNAWPDDFMTTYALEGE